MYKLNLVALASLSMLVVMASSQPSPQKEHYDVNNSEALFETFIKEYNRQYKDDADKEVHHQAFRKNLEKINELNEKSTSATYGINKFADYTDEESANLHGLRKPKPN